VRAGRDRLLLGASGRAPAAVLFAGCVILTAALGAAFAGQSRADAFDNAVESPFITLFAGHDRLLVWMAYPGTLVPVAVASVVIAACCLLAGRRHGAVLALTAAPLATVLGDHALKHIFDRTYDGALVYPSGHASSVVALTATLAVLLFIPPQRASTRPARLLVLAVGCVVTAVVVVAVMALRWHYFTDTVAGAAVGAGTVCALALILDLAWPIARTP
jgi:membrane-associated phospholipid phosphatase